MNNYLKYSAISLLGLSLALPVLGQTSATPSPLPSIRPIKELREMTKDDIQQMRMNFEKQIQSERDTLKTKIDAKRAALKTALLKIKDQRKQKTVEDLDQRFDSINQKMTDLFVSALDQMDDVLNGITTRVDSAQEKGIDVSSIRTAISSAHQAIMDARDAVTAQAAKTYNINVTTAANLRSSVKTTMELLKNDLKTVREKVKAARDSVHAVAVAFARVHGNNADLPGPTPEPSESPVPAVTP